MCAIGKKLTQYAQQNTA